MDAIDELIDAAQAFFEDARANENGRSRSWEHCYRVFRDARTDPSPDCDYLSLHLAFYLASWGMYRGSSFLLQKDYKVLVPIVEKILKPEYDCLFGVACVGLRDSEIQKRLKKLRDDIADHFRPIRDEVAGRKVASSVSRACQFFCVWGLEVGGDSVGVGGGELGEGLFPVGGGVSLDEAGVSCSFVGGFAGVCEALGGSFVFDVADGEP